MCSYVSTTVDTGKPACLKPSFKVVWLILYYNYRMRDLMMSQVGCSVPWLPDKSQTCTDDAQSAAAFKVT